jgi:hypothetical protein
MIQIGEFLLAEVLLFLSTIAFLTQIIRWNVELDSRTGRMLVRSVVFVLAFGMNLFFGLVTYHVKGNKGWSNLSHPIAPRAKDVEKSPVEILHPSDSIGAIAGRSNPVPKSSGKSAGNVRTAPTASSFAPEPEPPSVAFIYANHRIEVNNLGRKDLRLWGTKLAQGPVSMEDRATIVPIQPFNYHINADSFEREVLSKFGPNGEVRVPFSIFVSDEGGNKWTITCELWVIIKSNQLTVETRDLGATKGWGITAMGFPQ